MGKMPNLSHSRSYLVSLVVTDSWSHAQISLPWEFNSKFPTNKQIPVCFRREGVVPQVLCLIYKSFVCGLKLFITW